MLKLIQTGFLGSDPVLKFTPSGQPVAEFDLCTTERYTDKNTQERKELATWIRWEVWGTSAENLAKYLKKGSRVLVEGTIRNHSWFDEKTGEKRYRDRHSVSRWENMDRRSDQAPDNAPADNDAAPGYLAPDDVPPDDGFGALPPSSY